MIQNRRPALTMIENRRKMTYMQNTQILTITASDYSVEFKIKTEQYDFWKDHYFQAKNPMSEMAQFKIYV